ncbi:MAG: response regulator [Desulfovibrionaceae bacterium]|nr:response regulator [Desulfovibrionaceae bacterium]
MAHEILLDSGTNEVEILEFSIGSQSFGINVAKVTQIIPYDADKFTAIPDDSEAILGVFLWHGQTIPLIDLNTALRRKPIEQSDRPLVLVTKFNEVVNGFLISSVNRIRRVNWDDIDPACTLIEKHTSMITGSIHIKDRDILMIDFEFIIAELFPETKMTHSLEESLIKKELSRENAKIIFAEDSVFIRKNVVKLLRQVGYNHVSAFENGMDAFEHISALVKQTKKEGCDISKYIDLVVTDIEMPKMDGLTLCRRIKKELGLSQVPVAIFSSLIDEQMTEKCKEVGADMYTTKPKIDTLITLLDDALHIQAG